jgi:hypothetical protein
MAQNDFLLCRNCVKWGQPWRLGKKTIVCVQKGYTPDSIACKYFVPIDTLPTSLQEIRLFVQTLDDLQRHYFQWSLKQAQLVLTLRDALGKPLTMGDRVSFRLGLYGHIGTVEGVDPQCSEAIILSTPAFIPSSVSILASAITKTTPTEAREIINQGEDTPWKLPVLIQEITSLRQFKKTMTKEDSLALVHYEQQLSVFEKKMQQDALLKKGVKL